MGVDDPRTGPFADFLRSWIGKTDMVVLLGDIFDFYYGFRGAVFWQHLTALAALRDLTQAGVRVVYVEGNHEFQIAEVCEEGLGVEAMEGVGEVTVGGHRIYLCHGDRADPTDWGYRFLYFALRNRVTAAFARLLPPSWAWALARLASDTSRAYKSGRGKRLNDLYRQVARSRVEEGYHAALFGHSHMPALEEVQVDRQSGWFGNCGDGLEHRTYLRFDGNEFTLEEYPEEIPSVSRTGALAQRS